MNMIRDLICRFSTFQTLLKSFFLLVILFFIFFAINLFISIQNKSRSAYSVLSEQSQKSKLMLQDTRVHNWSEVDKKNKQR